MIGKSNPYMTRAATRGTSSHGGKSEKKVAAKLNARLTPASGALRGAKSDMTLLTKTALYQIESKSTIKSTLPVDLGWLVKVSEEALARGAVPALTMSFVTPEGTPKPRGEWVALPLWWFQEYCKDVGKS